MLRKFLIGWYHAKYHRKMKKAILYKEQMHYNKAKKCIYQAEDAWKQIVKLKHKK